MNFPASFSNQKTRQNNILYPATNVALVEASGPRVMKRAKGIHLIDEKDHQLIDGIAGLWCSNIGHGRPEIADVLHQASLQLDYFHTFNGHSNDAQMELAGTLIEMAPGDLSHVFFGCSGSDANDTLIKLSWLYHAKRGNAEKRRILSRWQSYHGTSIPTASATGLKGFHTAFNLPLEMSIHLDCPHYYRFGLSGESEQAFTARLLANLQETIDREGADTIAAFIGEPIMGAGGIITPPEGYWQGIQEICRRHDILVIADEVVCGYGRTGKDFGSQHYGIQPDMMTTAKGLTAGVFPMSAAFISQDVHDVIRQSSDELGGLSHGYTYSGHPIGAAVANKVQQIIRDEKLTENAKTIGNYLRQSLAERLADNPHVGEIRGEGLLAGIQLMKDAERKENLNPADKIPASISARAYEMGLIIRPLPSVNSLALSPPLVLTTGQADAIIDITCEAIEKQEW